MKAQLKKARGVQPLVVVIDDDALVRRGLERLLEANGYKTVSYESFETFAGAGAVPHVGCAILDLNLPGVSGLAVQEKLSNLVPDLSTIFLTGFGKVDSSVRAMKAGAVDFLEKPVDDAVLIRAVERAVARSEQRFAERLEQNELHRRFERLSEREREVFALITSGLLNKQAAAELGVVEKTIKMHRAHIMEKMEAGSFAELAKMAHRLGLDARSAATSFARSPSALSGRH